MWRYSPFKQVRRVLADILGKSYLIENHQSYFFVKNDPVKKLISGPAQGAVICESGRLFVWGENQFGQLGTNSSSTTGVLTKPTCVKSLKAIGEKVLDVAFGSGWSVMLTNENSLYFSGRNIFPKESTAFENFEAETVSGKEVFVARKPFRLEALDQVLKDEDEHFCEVASGNDHFVVLTTSGRLFGYGSNAFCQFGIPGDEQLVPVEIKIDAKIQSVACGPKSTIILTENEELFITGHLNEFQFPRFTELVHTFSDTKITCMQISQSNEIYLVTWEGDIYRSTEAIRTGNLLFQKFYDYPNEENGTVLKLLKGNAFYAALTKTKKLFTTFSESGHHLKTFREISKLRNLKILDFTVGDEHILVLGIPKSSRFGESRGVSGKASFLPTYNGETIGESNDKNANIVENGIKSEELDDNKNKINAKTPSAKWMESPQMKKPTDNEHSDKISETKIINEALAEKNEHKPIPKSAGESNNGVSTTPLNNSVGLDKVGSEQKMIASPGNSQSVQNGHIEEKNEDKTTNNNNDLSEHFINGTRDAIVHHTDQGKPKSATSNKSISSKQNEVSGKLKEGHEQSSEEDEVRNLPNSAQQSLHSHKGSSPATSVGSNKTVLNQTRIGSTPTPNEVLSSSTKTIISNQEQILLASNIKGKTPEKHMTRNDSERSIKFDAKSIKSEKSVERIPRPQTPFPNHSVADGNKHLTPLNGHYEPSNTDSTSLNLVDSLENINDGVKEDPTTHEQHPNLDAQNMKTMAQQIPRTLPALKTPPNFSRRQLLVEDDPQDEDKLEIEFDVYDSSSETAVNEIRFINDGVDVTDRIENEDDVKIHSFSDDFPDDEEADTAKVGKESKKETNSPVKEIQSATKKFIVTEAVIQPPSGPSTAKESIKEAVHQHSPKNIEKVTDTQLETSPNKHEMLKKIPVAEEKFKRIVEDDERTTASAKSSNTGKRFGNDSEGSEKDKASFTEIDLEKQSTKEDEQENEKDPAKPTRVKRFISDLKTKSREISCRNSNSVHVEDDGPNPVAAESSEQKTSKICTIL